MDAAPSATPRTLPVLVFSHGYTDIPSAYTALLEDLASHGYAVERPVLGTMAPARASEITTVIVRQYFEQALLGQRSTLLAGTPHFPEVTVRTFPPAR